MAPEVIVRCLDGVDIIFYSFGLVFSVLFAVNE